MERYNWIERTVLITMTLLVMVGFVQIPIENAGGSSEGVLASRTIDTEGGEYSDRLTDLSKFEDLNNVTFFQNGLMGRAGMVEDFEAYSNNYNLIGTNEWKFVTGYSTGNFITTSTSVNGFPSVRGSSLRSTNTNTEVAVLSKVCDKGRGVLSFLISTSKVDSSTVPTTQFVVLGNSSDLPKITDRIVSIGFSESSLGYSNGTWHKMVINPSPNSFYMVLVEFDGQRHKINITITNEDSTNLGSAIDVGYQNKWASIRQFELISCKKPGVGYVYSYYDQISLIDHYPAPSARTREIAIENGYNWGYLDYYKYTRLDMDITVSFLDPNTNDVISGLQFDGSEGYMDLGFLNDAGITSIKLRFDYKLRYLFSPVLGEINLEWNSSHAWRDSFILGNKVAYLSGMSQGGGYLSMQPNQKNGVYWSKGITIPSHHYWDKVMYTAEDDESAEILIDLLDPYTNRSIPGFSDLKGPAVSIRSLNPIDHPMFKVRFRVTNKGTSPYFDTIAVTWVGNTGPEISLAPLPTIIKRASSTEVRYALTDIDQDPETLDLWVRHRYIPDGTWETNYLSPAVFDPVKMEFTSIFTPPEEARVGAYEISVFTRDEMGNLSYESTQVEVRNNVPDRPTIGISPSVLMRGRSFNIYMIEPGHDIETAELGYDLHFCLDGVEETTCAMYNLSMTEPIHLPEILLIPGKKLIIRAYTNDSLDLSEEFNLTIKVLNAPPEFIGSGTISIEMLEDEIYQHPFNLSGLVKDPDGDAITVEMESIPDLTISYEPTSDILTIVPNEDESGLYEVPFTFSTEQDKIEGLLSIDVASVNDPPTGELLTETAPRYLVGETVELKASISDKDDPVSSQIISWRSGNLTVGTGPSVNFTSDVPLNITIGCYISDGKYEGLLGELPLSFVLPDPPFTSEEIDVEYSNNTSPVLFTVTDILGKTKDHYIEDIPGVNITKVGIMADGRNVIVYMDLKGSPLDVLDQPLGSASGIWAEYRIYFVKGTWSEPAFEQDELDLYNNRYAMPGEESSYKLVGTENGYLEMREVQTFGGPTVSGSRVIWTLPMTALVDSGMTSADLNIFGAALYYNSSETGLVAGFDTAGYGSKDHPVVVREVKDEEEEQRTVPLGLFLALLIVLLIIVIVLSMALVLSFLVGKKGAAGERGTVPEVKEEEKKDVVPEKEPEKGPLPVEKPAPPTPQPPALKPPVSGAAQPTPAQLRIAQQVQALQMMRAQQFKQAPPTQPLPPAANENRP